MKNSLYITGGFTTFTKNYIDAKKHKTSGAIAYCLRALNDCFITWDLDFSSNVYHQNINLNTLYALLKADNKPLAPLEWKIDTYKNYLYFYNLTLKDHLIECFLKHINKETIVYSTYSKKYKLLYFLAREIKYNLFKIIRGVCQLSKRDYSTNKANRPPKINSYEEAHTNIDLYFLFSQNRLLYSVILSIIYENISWKQIKQKYELSNTQLKKIKSETHKWINKTL